MMAQHLSSSWKYTEEAYRSQAHSLGFRVLRFYSENLEHVLRHASILVLLVPTTPHFSESELNAILDFVERGGGLSIVVHLYAHRGWGPRSEIWNDFWYNALYRRFGLSLYESPLELSLSFSHGIHQIVANISSNHPILENVHELLIGGQVKFKDEPSEGFIIGIPQSKVHHTVALVSELKPPANAILTAFDKELDKTIPLLLSSIYGSGKVFVDLTSGGIGFSNKRDNYQLVRNVLRWLKGRSSENFLVDVRQLHGTTSYKVNILSDSLVSNFVFHKGQGKISFNLTDSARTNRFCNLTIPNKFMQFNKILLDGSTLTSFFKSNNATHVSLYFTYPYGTHVVEVYGSYAFLEFSPSTTLPLFIVIALLPIFIVLRSLFKQTKDRN